MRIIICGSRYWTDKESIFEIISWLKSVYSHNLIIIHGGAKGADTIAGSIAAKLNIPVEVYPANWNKHGRAAGPIRNREMLSKGADLVVGFTYSLDDSKGTANMINLAKQAGVSTLVFGGGDIEFPINWEEI